MYGNFTYICAYTVTRYEKEIKKNQARVFNA